MTRARRELLSLEDTPYYHCICRCVRRAFLCGKDAFSGKSFEHRKGWVLERLRELEAVFAVDLCAYAIMSNHYHLVVRLDRERVSAWTDAEVIERWKRLYSLPLLVAEYERNGCTTETERELVREVVGEWRRRLCDLSWYMRSLNEHLARRANEADGCKGRFWEGRFKSQALLDEAAVLTCMSYVDLNPVRAGMTETPEASDFTSIQQRIRELQRGSRSSEAPHLVALDEKHDEAHPNGFRFSTRDYLELVDWAGRTVRSEKRGAIPSVLPPILARLNLDPNHFLGHIARGGRAHHVTALGHVSRLRRAAEQLGRKFLKGLTHSQRLFLRPV